MEASFGASLSAVKLYASDAVADHAAQAVTQGNAIGFAAGALDFTSTKGQALLGHELSHVVSQARGEARGGGFLNDAALETRAEKKAPPKHVHALPRDGRQLFVHPGSGRFAPVRHQFGAAEICAWPGSFLGGCAQTARRPVYQYRRSGLNLAN